MKKAFIITVSILSFAIIVLGVVLFTTNNTLTTTTASLESIYQRSFYELVNNVNNMEVEVSKLLVSNDSTSQQKSLTNIKEQSSDAGESLSLLPVSSNILSETTKFMNKVNGYCTSLITYKDGKIEGEDYNALSEIHKSIETIKTELNTIMEKIMHGYRISDNLGNGSENSNFNSNFINFASDTISYPSLIYDGPFSESVMNKNIKGLPETEVSQEDAKKNVENIFGNNLNSIELLGETTGKFNTFDYKVEANDRTYYVQIAKRGGFLLTMSANGMNNNVEANKTTSQSQQNSTDVQESIDAQDVNDKNSQILEAISKAETFVKDLGLDNMKCVWSASSDKIAYVNIAPIIDDIIMYPDLIKVKIDLNDYQIIGYEASSYAYNHIEREDLIAQLDATEAKKLINDNLNVKTQKLCVIPLDYVGETLAYEFAGDYQGYQYYLYIDAYTGNQVRVLRVIQTDQGELVL